MPFRDPEAGDLSSRIRVELQQRIEEALDAACLDTVVRGRQARGLPPPEADSERDRQEYHQALRQLLERLHAHFIPTLERDLRVRVLATTDAPADRVGYLTAVQVALARELPDYWQRFDVVRIEYGHEHPVSGRERRGLLRRLFSHG